MYSSFVSHLVGIRTVSTPSGTPRKFIFKRIFHCKPFILRYPQFMETLIYLRTYLW